VSTPGLTDVARYDWLFFPRIGDRRRGDSLEACRESFGQVLDAGHRWAGGDGTPPMPRLGGVTPRQSVLLAEVPWTERDGTLRLMQARTLLDSYLMLLGQERPSNAGVGTELPEPWAELGGRESYGLAIGEATCLAAATDPIPADISDNVLERMARSLTPGLPVEGVLLGGCYVGFSKGSGGTPDTYVVLYGESSTASAEQLVHLALPQIALARTKYRRIEEYYYEDLFTVSGDHLGVGQSVPSTGLLAQARANEQVLDDLLWDASEKRLALEDLEGFSTDISARQADLVKALCTLEEASEALCVNIRNVERVLQVPLWGDARDSVYSLLTDDMALLQDQLAADLRGLRITQEQADRALQSLQTAAGIRVAQWERRMTVLLGVFAVMAPAQVWQTSPVAGLSDDRWRGLLVLAGAGAFALLFGSTVLWSRLVRSRRHRTCTERRQSGDRRSR